MVLLVMLFFVLLREFNMEKIIYINKVVNIFLNLIFLEIFFFKFLNFLLGNLLIIFVFMILLGFFVVLIVWF